MAKRFTDTDKYKKPFIRGLKGPYKLLWDYLYHDCNHAGIWIVDFDIAQIYIGSDMEINISEALIFFNDGEKRIIQIDNNSKWFIPSFIDFQYGELNENNRAHNSVITILKKYKLYNSKGLIRSLQGRKDKDKDKDMDKDMDKDKEELAPFDEALKNYQDMRNKIGKKMTDKAKELVLNKLSKLSQIESDQIEILNQSTMNSWQGVFPLRENNQNKTSFEKTMGALKEYRSSQNGN